ncbi:MAG: hypothetical protein OXE58_10190 [Acidobacteria bacterium]|nr:hypothetical protein [Acidobacteriota bacterium]
MRSVPRIGSPRSSEDLAEEIRSEVADLHADTREGLGHVVERLDTMSGELETISRQLQCLETIDATLREIAGTLKAINERESWKRGDPDRRD